MTKTKTEPEYIMHTTDGCKYCRQAKALFDYYNLRVEFKEEKSADWPTYPAIYKVIQGSEPLLIGGFDELAQYSYDNGL